MTNSDISGFLSSISEAKRAFDQEPFYLKQISELERDKQRLGETVAARELRIHELKQIEDHLNAKLRSVEAERDDAGFRHLEADEKVQGLLTAVRGFVNEGLKCISAVEGHEVIAVNKVELEAKSKEISELQWKASETDAELQRLKDDMRLAQEQLTRPFAGATSSSQGEGTDPLYPKEPKDLGQRVADPFANNPSSSPPQSPNVSSANVALTDDVYTTSDKRAVDPTASGSAPIPQGLGQSEKSPIGEPQVGSQEGQSEGPFAFTPSTEPQTASVTTVETLDVVPSNASPPERNRDRSTFFTGRKYFDVTYFVPLHQWLNEGGSREDYYWRPAEANVALPEPNRASHQS